MKRLVFTAQDFAFGSIGPLLYLADLLKDKNYVLIFVGFGTSLQLAKKFPFHKIYELDTEDPKNTPQLEKIISKSDAVISCTDIPSIVAGKKFKKITVWEDVLFWFWPTISEELFDIDLYVRERAFDASVNEARYGTKIKNLLTVGPIMGSKKKITRKKQAMISFGGAQATHVYQVGKDTNYPFVMTEILSKQVNWSEFDKVFLTSSEHVIELLKARFPNIPFELTTLAHDRFMTEMSQSQVILITPGLITTQCAFYSETPVIFLPPSNDSQYLQLDELRKLSLAPASVHLNDFFPKLNLLHLPGAESTQLVMEQLRMLENSPDIRIKIGSRLNELVQSRDVWSKESVPKAGAYIKSLGGNGAQLVAEEIKKLIDLSSN